MVAAKPCCCALAAWLLRGRGAAGLRFTFRGHHGLPWVQAAGCRHLSSRDATYWPSRWVPRAADAHVMLRGRRRRARCEIHGDGHQYIPSTASSSPPSPARSITLVASPGKGLCSTHGWGGGTGKLALSGSALSQD